MLRVACYEICTIAIVNLTTLSCSETHYNLVMRYLTNKAADYFTLVDK